MQTHNFGNIDGVDAVDGARGETGETGARGVGFIYRGDWVAGGSYSNADDIDVVKYKNNYYYCKQSTFRSNAPDYDTATWGLFVSGESSTILRCTFSAADWESYYDENLQETVQKAVAEFSGITIPSDAKYFINADPNAAAVYGIKLAAVGGNTIAFYASAPCAVTIDFCYKTMRETVVEAENVAQSFTTFKVVYNQDTSAYVSLNLNRPRIVDWGDGTVESTADSLGVHRYKNYGTYYAKVKGAIVSPNYPDVGWGFFAQGNEYERRNRNIESIEFTDNKLGEFGCAYCDNLKTVKLSGKETRIPTSAFEEAESLSTLQLHEGILSIEEYAFSSSGIQSLELPNTIAAIGAGCFRATTQLTRISIPPRVTRIEDYTFMGSAVKHVYLGRGIQYIGHRVFRNTLHCTVHYDGTIAEWEAIEKSHDWDSPTLTVICSDGYA